MDSTRKTGTARDALHPNERESTFISAIRLLMIAGLVYHHLFEIPGSSHSPRHPVEGVSPFLPEFLNAFLHMAFMAAVPVLSVISGYLFFRRPALDFTDQLKRRFRTVALPSWLWAAFWLACGYLLFQAGVSWAAYGFEDFGVMTVLNGVFGLAREPFALQFWFVHDLILTLLAAPLIHFLLLRLGWGLLLAMAVFWLAVPWPPLLFSFNVPMFFTLGAWLALREPGLEALLRRLDARLGLLLPLFAAALFLRVMAHLAGPLQDFLQGHLFLCLLRILGVLALSALLHCLVRRGSAATRWLARYSGYSFFLFAAHYPLIEAYQSLALRLPGHASAWGLTLSWALLPLLTIITCLLAASILERLLPGLFGLINGGRGRHPGARSPTGRGRSKRHWIPAAFRS